MPVVGASDKSGANYRGDFEFLNLGVRLHRQFFDGSVSAASRGRLDLSMVQLPMSVLIKAEQSNTRPCYGRSLCLD